MEITIVTGLSGAGKSRVVDALEDIGYFCVDNMPPKLMPTFAQLLLNSREKREKVAIVTDIRVGASFGDLFNAIVELKELKCDTKLLFIDASMMCLSADIRRQGASTRCSINITAP